MSFLNDVLNIFIKYYPQLLTGVGNTLLIALTSTAAGLALGLLTGVVRTAPMSKNPVLRALHKLLNAIIAIYVEIFRGTPMMVQSMVIYWGYAFATGGDTLPLIPSGILIVSINTGAYMAEIVRVRHADGHRALKLAAVDGDDAAAHDLGHIGAGVDGHDQDA